MQNTCLLCTFSNADGLDSTLQQIRDTYHIDYSYIYVLQNKVNVDDLFITYNIDTTYQVDTPLYNTILIHRKKESNTIYTINALNQLVREENSGIMDSSFVLDWQKYKNSIILTTAGGLKKIQTKVYDIISFSQSDIDNYYNR